MLAGEKFRNGRGNVIHEGSTAAIVDRCGAHELMRVKRARRALMSQACSFVCNPTLKGFEHVSDLSDELHQRGALTDEELSQQIHRIEPQAA